MSDAEPPETWIWTDADLERLSWHDARVHGIAFDPNTRELELDVDVLLKWSPRDRTFDFDVGPATLVFHDVYDLGVTLDPDGRWVILGHERTADEADPDGFRWRFDFLFGEITFTARGFTQWLRQRPRRLPRQSLTREERGGVSFARRTPLP